MTRYIDPEELKANLGEPPENLTSSAEEIQALNDFYMFQTLIDAQPTADVRENVKGEWQEKDVIHEVEASTAIDEWQSARCSVCGKYHTTPYLYYFDDFNYCPNCGADMRGGDTE